MLLLSLGLSVVLSGQPRPMPIGSMISYYVLSMERVHIAIMYGGDWEYDTSAGCEITDPSGRTLFKSAADEEQCSQIILSRKASIAAIPRLAMAIRAMPETKETLDFARESARLIYEPIDPAAWKGLLFTEEMLQ